MFLDNLRADVRHTIRLAINAPLYTSLVVFALALGIGANSAIFTVVHSVLLRPLLYEDPSPYIVRASPRRAWTMKLLTTRPSFGSR